MCAQTHTHSLTHIVLPLCSAHFIGVSHQDVHEAQPRLLTRRLVQQVGAVGEFPQLLLLVVGERHSCTREGISQ